MPDVITTPRKLWHVEQVCELLDLPDHRVYDFVRQGKIPCVRIGRLIRFDPARIEQWIASGGSPQDAT